MEKFVVYNPNTKEYFKRGYGFTTDAQRARIYNRPCHARNSLNRKRRSLSLGWDVYAIEARFPMDGATVAFDTVRAVNDGNILKFKVVVDYFRDMYGIDITGEHGDLYPMSVDLIVAFGKANRYLKGFGNGDRFMITEKMFENEKPLVMMLASEIIKMFGYETQGRRVAIFEIDWCDLHGLRRRDY